MPAFLVILLAAMAATAVQTSTAEASSIYVTRIREEGSFHTTLHVDSRARQRNRLSVHVARRGGFVIRDVGERLRLRRGAACERVSRHRVRCSAQDEFAAALGPGRDTAVVTTSSVPTGPPEVELDGHAGADTLRIGHGGTLRGGSGNDIMSVGSRPIARSSFLHGGPGDDNLRGSTGQDLLAGGEGDDVAHGGPERDELYGGNDVDPLRANAGRDRLYGGRGPDLFDDNDRTRPRRVGSDRMVGGFGDDSVFYRAARKPVFVNLREPGGDGQRGENDVVLRMENITGGGAADTLVGDGDTNTIDGGPGGDRLRGLGGDDHLWASGRDRVQAGAGADEIITLSPVAVRLGCGSQTDTVVNGVGRQGNTATPFVPADCERMSPTADVYGVRETFALASTPTLTPAGDLTFEVFRFVCCETQLRVTSPGSPFEEYGSASVDANTVTIRLPADVAQRVRDGMELRAETFGGNEFPLAWRFVPAPG
jgi:hypothetical protein